MPDWLDIIIHFFSDQPPVDILAVITGLVYVVLAARNHILCWPFGIISSALTMYSVFFNYDLYLETFLMFVYVIMGIWGWIEWSPEAGKQKKARSIGVLSLSEHVWIIFGGTLLTVVVGFIFEQSTNAQLPYIDAFTTIFALIATAMTAYRLIENWWYWVVIDAVSIYLYTAKGANFYSLLYGVYVIVAVIGYFEWQRQWKKQQTAAELPVHTAHNTDDDFIQDDEIPQ